MERGRLRANIVPMNRPQPLSRYMLVPRAPSAGAPLKRYSLARVGVSPAAPASAQPELGVLRRRPGILSQ